MTSLNPSLRLALINKAKSKKSILQKGFTLVELMVVIVIVGTLSAIALPSFLGQSLKAKATECNAKIGGLLSQAAQEAQTSGNITKAESLGTELAANWTKQSKNCEFTLETTAVNVMRATAIGKGDLLKKYSAGACQNYEDMLKGLEYDVSTSGADVAPDPATLLTKLATDKACDTVTT